MMLGLAPLVFGIRLLEAIGEAGQRLTGASDIRQRARVVDKWPGSQNAGSLEQVSVARVDRNVALVATGPRNGHRHRIASCL